MYFRKNGSFWDLRNNLCYVDELAMLISFCLNNPAKVEAATLEVICDKIIILSDNNNHKIFYKQQQCSPMNS